MNQHLRATGLVLGMLTIVVSTAIVVRLAFEYLTPSMAPIVLGTIGISICLYVLYSIALAKIQFDDTIKQMVDRK